MLDKQSQEKLKHSKNLLAFSAGVDSTALLFLLIENKIKFDIAIVDYGLRSQSKDEVAYAQELAKLYNFQCHIYKANKIDSNFEANARKIRYEFFENLIKEKSYETLLTAHHLGDRFEWMLMQFCKGAGCLELSGMKTIEQRMNYKLIRPLLKLEKQELLEYLIENKIQYFEDQSNTDEKYKRNSFRHKHTKPLLEEYLSGIKKSFEYIDEDVRNLLININVNNINKFAYFKSTNSKRSDIYAIDKYLKSALHIITATEKGLLKSENSVVVGRKFVICQEHGYIFIAPYIKEQNLSKEFKEKMRLLKVNPKLRGYLFSDIEAVEFLSGLLA